MTTSTVRRATSTMTQGSVPIRSVIPRDGLVPVSLAELDASAALQTRVDRKYLVPPSLLTGLYADFADRVRVLEIDGRRTFDYLSVYFDTPDLLCFHQHLQGRRRRFKVRTRTYLDSGLCRLEVKGKGPRAETVKKHRQHPAGLAARLTPEARRFVARRLDAVGVVERLRPTLSTEYRRTTLFDAASGSRVTCDEGLRFAHGAVRMSCTSGAVLLETKSERGAGPIDRWLWRHHVRPQSMSKYCLGAALLHPGLRANPWHRILRGHFDWAPE